LTRSDNEEGIMSVSDTLVLVEMGELIQGTIDKRTVGNGQNNNNKHNSNSGSSSGGGML